MFAGYPNVFTMQGSQEEESIPVIAEFVKEKGFTIIPTLLYINEKGFAKLSISLARGKHHYDKRETLKQKDVKREIERSKE